ncbi:MAG: hypothetical protein A2Y00_10910 [Omnitrophica WOR_2 bacterium GWF2_43_52]|nr:MAG: hypothetical protein A2Y01_01135 [Omnitrophica WOR_2 bacterium GWC2_44_8]OGX20797.1 MAG: hypothetical protein A2Y00_10910 [Omnitrophica WOR_2 bacterium GWF2_43_52]OGX54278.1 MAG: hypothetical protein A2460_01385 [Omnitrophica WOR_2 bacterium RIFOXYC2_FULL_43_9]HAH19826.1 hypothetical protein [Candidatus Omnitrophota bacterium]HBG63450.1 hypothetical protein [Candidatus Omnitrophota bacterium]
MILKVKVIPRARRNDIKLLGEDSLKIHLVAPAVSNKANEALVEILAHYYTVKKNQVWIVRGKHSRNKVVEINAR